MFAAYREVFRYGRQDDPTDLTIKDYETLEKAIAYIKRYAKGIRFCSAYVEDENGNVIYEILNCGADEYDHREKFGY